MFGRRLAAAVLTVAVSAVSACSDDGGTRAKPADLSLSDTGNGCVDLTQGADSLASWCGTNITSFDVERTYEHPDGGFGLLLVVSGQLLASKDYEIWDQTGNFVLVASTRASESVKDLTYLVQSKGRTFRCHGQQQVLECTAESN